MENGTWAAIPAIAAPPNRSWRLRTHKPSNAIVGSFLSERRVTGASQFRRAIQQALGWALVLLLGPAPLASLLAEPECQMACCERKHAAHSCPRHQSVASSATSVQFEASTGCPPGCSHAAVGPSLSVQVLASARTTIGVPNAESGQTHSSATAAIRSTIDPTLYQRPPPLPA